MIDDLPILFIGRKRLLKVLLKVPFALFPKQEKTEKNY